MRQYFGILDGSGDVWGVRLPDLPGCHGGGANAMAALTDAISAAQEWAAYHTAKDRILPKSSGIKTIASKIKPGEVIVKISLSPDASVAVAGRCRTASDGLRKS